MELLELQPPEYGVQTSGIYIIDDDGRQVCAGPFPTATDAIVSIESSLRILRPHHETRDHTEPPGWRG
jgi:hypothetical protein